ncbi:unnamed protein product [Ostreobium quekettii]|uniref:BZIP domain-containing protein n=1 Tax=Ostreobium quekettii TaxID=121088 RepID=A0A8S1IXL6_9CHLO|nr:unnamed protein product [Ostreobium quekettii]
MDRSFSVDDLVGGIWRLGQAGVGRSDSEAAFQELLKGFPSTNNLAAQASGGVDCGQDGAVEEGQNGEREAGEKAASISGFGAAGLPGGMSTGFPTTSIPQVDLSSLPHVLQANGLQAALSAVPGLQGAAHPLVAAAAGLSPAAAAAAAALQLSQLSNAAVVAQAPPAGMDRESLEKAEQRRARRMLSNRESARRSRRRKQDHLMTMEDQINILLEDKRKWMETKESLERRCELAEEESRKLREENQRLRDELRILDLVVSWAHPMGMNISGNIVVIKHCQNLRRAITRVLFCIGDDLVSLSSLVA